MKFVMDCVVAMIENGLIWLFIWSWQAAIVVASVGLGLKISRATSPAIRHQIWLLCLIAVAVLPVWGVVVQFLPLPQPNSKALFPITEFPKIITSASLRPVNQISSALPDPSSDTTLSYSVTIWNALFVAWLVGALIVLGRIVVKDWKLRHIRLGARPATLADLNCVDCRGPFGRVDHISIGLSDHISSPILLGVLRPTILLPADILQWTTAAERRAMIVHELAHIARRDPSINLFLTILCVIFYFHPLVIYACRQLRIEREMACDDQVIDLGAAPETYAESILKVAERKIMPSGARQLAIISSKRTLEKRIEMIMNKDRVRYVIGYRRRSVPAILLISALIWILVPARSEPAGSRFESPLDQKSFSNDVVGVDVTLTTEQKEQIMGASEKLSELSTLLLNNTSSEEIYQKLGFTGLGNMRGFCKNASPLSSRLAFKIMYFDRPVTITLTEEQRRQIYQTINRSITELRLEPAQDRNDLDYMLSISLHQRIIENLKNTIKPDAYDVYFPFVEGEGIGNKMFMYAHYRNIHRWLGHYYPNFYPSQSDQSSR